MLNKNIAFNAITTGFRTKKRRPEGLLVSNHAVVRIVGLEPTRLTAPDPKSGLSTNFNISASLRAQRYILFLKSPNFQAEK